MRDLHTARLTALVALGVTLYLLPTLIALTRHGSNVRRVALLNGLAGWTIVGWILALVCALREVPNPPLASDAEWRRPQGERPLWSSPLYRDGSYLISQAGSARTWAVHSDGRWGIVYELDETERASTWVEPDDIPLDVLARALRDAREARR